jgi:hypothetical protein
MNTQSLPPTLQKKNLNPSKPLVLLAFFAGALLQFAALADVVVTTDHNTTGYTVSSTDLLQGPGVLTDTNNLNLNGPESAGGNTISNLTDGFFGIPGGNGLAIASGVLIYTLDTSVNTNGYDISAINTYGGWPNWGRSEQQYDVAYSTVDDTNTFTDIATGVDSGYYIPDVPSYTAVYITDNTNPWLATRVSAVRFTFPAQLNGGAGYRELDVIGQADAGNTPVAPTIVTQPQNAAVALGSAVSFSVTASGTGPLYYQWYMNQTNLLAGQTSATLSLSGVGYPNVGAYSVLVSNSVGVATSSNAILNVENVDINHGSTPYLVSSSDLLQSPGITVDSSALAIDTGDSGSYGAGSLTDGVFPTDGGAFAISSGLLTYILDTTVYTQGYTITNISTYGAWANWGRSDQSYTVSYSTVANPSNFVDIVTADTGYYLDDVPSYTSIVIYNTNRPVLATGVKAIRFKFPTQLNNGTGYGELDVFGSPIINTTPAAATIVTQPQDASVPVGSPLTLFVLAAGYPLPTYQWIMNSTNTLIGQTNATLMLPSVGPGDVGFYSVTVSNSLGGQISRQASVRVVSITYDHATVPYTVSSDDLLQTSLGSVDSSLLQVGPENDGFGLSSLADGVFNIGTDGIMFSIAGGDLMYYLDNAAFRGFAVSNINVFGGWANPGRANQNYTVSYSTVSAPSNFVFIATIAYTPPGSAPDYASVGISDVSGGVLATGVRALKFHFGPQQNGYAGYNEIDVLGAIIPVPEISLVQKTVSGTSLALTGSPNQNYSLFRATQITGPWTNIVTIPMDGNGMASFTDTNAPPTSGYYRLFGP